MLVLNECIHAGPSLTGYLYSVLLRFNSNRVSFIADIEKAFLQISLNPEHRDFVLLLKKSFTDLQVDDLDSRARQMLMMMFL